MNIEQLIKDCPCVSLCSTKKHYPHHTDNDDLALLKVDSAFCSAVISLQGAQILEFDAKPKLALGASRLTEPASPLLWLSPLASFKQGKSIRGGIPVCLPWFGVNQTNPEKPKHGFLRNNLWQLARCEQSADQHIELQFTYQHAAQTALEKALFEFPFSASLTLSLDRNLTLTLEVNNMGNDLMPLTWALHSYHPVDELNTAKVMGLSGQEYLDNADKLERKLQPVNKQIEFSDEVDRVYTNSPGTLRINNIKPIWIESQNAPTAIIWNPGKSLGESMPDVGEYYRDYVCVERGAAFDDEVELKANEALEARVVLSH